MTSYHAQLQHDPAFRAFVQAYAQAAVERARIDVHASRVERERDAEVIASLKRENAELRAQVGMKGRKK